MPKDHGSRPGDSRRLAATRGRTRGRTRQGASQRGVENSFGQRPGRSRRRTLRAPHLALGSRLPKRHDLTTHCARRPSGGVNGRGRVDPLRDGGIARPDASGQEPLVERGSRHPLPGMSATAHREPADTLRRMNDLAPQVTWTISVVSLFFAVLPFILLARISHWTHKTQARLEETNRLLAALLEQARPVVRPATAPRASVRPTDPIDSLPIIRG